MMTGRRDFSSILCCAYLAALLLVLHTPQGHAVHEINCRKYVFAPVCRGVAAKRSSWHSSPFQSASNNLMRIPGFQEYLLARRKVAF